MRRQAPLAKFQLAVKDETFWVLGFGLKVLVNPTAKPRDTARILNEGRRDRLKPKCLKNLL